MRESVSALWYFRLIDHSRLDPTRLVEGRKMSKTKVGRAILVRNAVN